MSYVSEGAAAYWCTHFINELERVRDKIDIETHNLYDLIRDKKKEFDFRALRAAYHQSNKSRIMPIVSETDKKTVDYMKSNYGVDIEFREETVLWHTGVPEKDLKIGSGLSRYLGSIHPEYEAGILYGSKRLRKKKPAYVAVFEPPKAVPNLQQGDLVIIDIEPLRPILAAIPKKKNSVLGFHIQAVPFNKTMSETMDYFADNVFGIKPPKAAEELSGYRESMNNEIQSWVDKNVDEF